MSSLEKKSDSRGQLYWRSFEQRENSPQYLKFLEEEFPEGASVDSAFINRRSFLSLLGASLAFAGVVGCRRPVEKIVPFVNSPENLVLGEPEHYATAMPLGTTAYGMVVTCNEGRPTKIEGNELHPSSLGKTNTFMQAAILDLYDPDRARNIKKGEFKSSWDEFELAWTEIGLAHKANKGEGLALICGESSSPTFNRLKKEFLIQYPKAKWVVYNAVSDENIYRGLNAATGKKLSLKYHYDQADIILALDSDFLYLESDNVAAANGFAHKRNIRNKDSRMNRLYIAEAGYSITGAAADHRLRVKSSHIFDFTLSIATEIEKQGVTIPTLPLYRQDSSRSFDKQWIQAVAQDLVSHQGRAIITAGRSQSPRVHSLVFAMNQALQNHKHTIDIYESNDLQTSSFEDLQQLAKEIENDNISTLLVVNANPVYDAPVDLKFSEIINNVKNSIHLGNYEDETAKSCKWRVNQAHFLESWGDCRAADTAPSIIQPMISPLFYGISDIEFLNLVNTGELLSGYELLRKTWETLLKGTDFESSWRKVLHDGILNQNTEPVKNLGLNQKSLESYLKSVKVENRDKGLELVFAADHSTYDGRFVNNGWMQELPDPLSKIIWDNAALISKMTADSYGLSSGDIASIEFKGNKIEIPVWILPGQTGDVVTLPLGYGKNLGRVSENIGIKVNQIRFADHRFFATGAKISNTGKKHTLASTQDHGSMEGRPLIREATLKEYKADPEFARHEVHVPDLKSLWKDHQYDQGYQWGMSVDLNACIGCGVCTVACQSENNIPVVGKKQGDYGREMHWMRIDRYFGGDENHPSVRFQPLACQHCEMAPCEQVCPVAATVHDKEGLNVMTYNRCIGTRYCSNNCAYKARRFNFFNYTNELPELVKMVQNPDVTVRSRGVMEKCTYCIQRINRSKRKAKLEGRSLRDGEMRTACQQACPTEAIQFGNILDQKSKIVEARLSDRTYEVLAEFNLRPRTSYQAIIKNPNPDLES